MGTFKFHQYQVVGRKLPTASDEHPKIYRMKLWATNEVRAKSKFWYFLRKLKKVKKSNGQVLAINEHMNVRRTPLGFLQGAFPCPLVYLYLRRTQRLSRTMVSGCGIKAGQVITTCTRSTVTQPSTELWSRCTLRWLLATGSGFLVSRSSRLLPSRPNFARGKAPSNSTTPRSSSHWCSGK
ncbi:60S ribosomal protein L18a-2 isoform X1 [Prunus yedoensis var. nudiflora]|uniref:60S ribosomal protein L18a-2 isoform X1 n=1 Tax=Prunus yedoensis var. nudiflora TaxID=2094558 RepID=A0A314V5G0_PRUYE|nr:60S ribosomal protein L18a-2 isoform X1 [Prunus yedoensis var. nudiflora]